MIQCRKIRLKGREFGRVWVLSLIAWGQAAGVFCATVSPDAAVNMCKPKHFFFTSVFISKFKFSCWLWEGGDFIITSTSFHVYGEINISDTRWGCKARYICGIVLVISCDIFRHRSNRLCEKEFHFSSVKKKKSRFFCASLPPHWKQVPKHTIA